MSTFLRHERLSPSLLSELYELEEDTYRLSLREAERLHIGSRRTALYAMVAHANDTLDALPRLARPRNVRLGSWSALLGDSLRRLRDLALGRIDPIHVHRRVLASAHRAVDRGRLLAATAEREGDGALAEWCARWLGARQQLLLEVSLCS